MASKPKKTAPRASIATKSSGAPINPRAYRLKVSLLSGLITEKFAKKNPIVSRTILIRGDQTLEDLHEAIFDAHDRFDSHMYEFQFGKGPMDRDGLRYVMPMIFEELSDDGDKPPAGSVDETTIDSLNLKVNQSFGYWFDFGDDWWHQIDVDAIMDSPPSGRYPKVIERVGKSPPQYIEEDGEP